LSEKESRDDVTPAGALTTNLMVRVKLFGPLTHTVTELVPPSRSVSDENEVEGEKLGLGAGGDAEPPPLPHAPRTSERMRVDIAIEEARKALAFMVPSAKPQKRFVRGM
jgi:hypothetical protein